MFFHVRTYSFQKGTSFCTYVHSELAVGLYATRFIPLSLEQPKALYEVRGERLIERQIQQLQEAGIKDITIVITFKHL